MTIAVVVSLKSTVTEPEQLSVAVNTTGAGIVSPQSILTFPGAEALNIGSSVSATTVIVEEAVLINPASSVTVHVTVNIPFVQTSKFVILKS